jgi:hypothetical protein
MSVLGLGRRSKLRGSAAVDPYVLTSRKRILQTPTETFTDWIPSDRPAPCTTLSVHGQNIGHPGKYFAHSLEPAA